MVYSNTDARDSNNSFADGAIKSIQVSMVLNFYLSIFVTITCKHNSILEIPLYLLGILVYMGIVLGFITLIYSIIIIFPIVSIFKFFKMDNELNIALASGTVIFLLLMIGLKGHITSVSYVVVMYGMICGYAFMHGFNNNPSR
jgi:hypothetical protein